MSSHPVFSGVRFTRSVVFSVVFCWFFKIIFSSVVFFVVVVVVFCCCCFLLLLVVLFELHRFTASDHTFGIFKLFLEVKRVVFWCKILRNININIIFSWQYTADYYILREKHSNQIKLRLTFSDILLILRRMYIVIYDIVCMCVNDLLSDFSHMSNVYVYIQVSCIHIM